MRLNCTFDIAENRAKPTQSEMGLQNNRILKQPSEALDIAEFLERVGKGRAYVSGHFKDANKGRHMENLSEVNFISLDIDNETKKDGVSTYINYSRQDAIKAGQRILGAKPLGGYRTFTGQTSEGAEKFRLIYALEEAIDPTDAKRLITYVVESAGDLFDKACKEPHRIFQGTCNETWTYSDHRAISAKVVARILHEVKEIERKKAEAEQAKREQRRRDMEAYAGSSHVEFERAIEELKQMDLGDYLQRMGYSPKPKKGGYKMPCPIHQGEKDNFHIDYKSGAWVYVCFSGCSGAGGTIIDLHCELENVDVALAIKELCEMYNIEIAKSEREKATTSPTSIIKIAKHISEDKNAVQAILRAIEDNNRTLVTGAMGCGKTHFVLNDLYKWTQDLGKILIVVAPSNAQIDNLHRNKGIERVNKGLTYDGKTDRVVTTPESLPKVVGELGDQEYVLVVDESHERYTSLYRTGYQKKNIERAEETAYRSLHLTATPRPLALEKIERVAIETADAIENKVSIIKVPVDKIGDNMLSMTKDLLKAKRKVVLFNNNKDDNEAFAKVTEVKKEVVVAEYEEGQLSLLKKDKPVERVEMQSIVKAETIYSGKESKSVEEGKLDAHLTCTTSAVLAGIDLEIEKSAVLLVNCRGVSVDNLIQLIGRFREGIEVILVVGEVEPMPYFDFEDRCSYEFKLNENLANYLNSVPGLKNLHDDGFKRYACLDHDGEKWIVDKAQVVAGVYEAWNKAVYSDTKRLRSILQEQTAFKVKKVVIGAYQDEAENTISELKKATKAERKQVLEETTEKLLQLEDDALYDVLKKDYRGLDSETEIVAKKHREVAEKQFEKLSIVEEKLYTDEETGVVDTVGAFRHLTSRSFAEIQREIKSKQAREINRLIKEHGLEVYMSSYVTGRFKRAVDVVQAKIRHELQEVEKKRGRISAKVFTKLVKQLIEEGYVYSKDAKAYKDASTSEDKKKALEAVGKTMREQLHDIYNFDSTGKVQSPKI